MEFGEGLSKVKKAVEAVIKTYDPRAPEVPFENVNLQSVAQIIDNQLGNTLRTRIGLERYHNGINAELVFVNMRVVGNDEYPTSTNPNVVKKRIEDSMKELARLGILEEDSQVSSGPYPDYKVKERNRLIEIASRSAPEATS